MAGAWDAVDAIWARPFAAGAGDEAETLRELVRCAILAPNAHNTQPWRFALGPGTIRILPDYARSMPHGDPGDRELMISLGCALENLCVAARRAGYAPCVEYFPAAEHDVCALVRLESGADGAGDPLFDAIADRHTNRGAYDGRPIPAADLAELQGLCLEPGVRIRYLMTAADKEAIIRILNRGFAWQKRNRAFQRELHSWMRFSRAKTIRHLDGLCARAIGKPLVPDPLAHVIVHAMTLSGYEAREMAQRVRGSSGLIAVLTERNDRRAWLDAGRSLQRTLLCMTQLGLRTAHLNQNWQWPVTTEPLARYLGLDGEYPQVVLRIGYAPPLPHSPRRPVESVLVER